MQPLLDIAASMVGSWMISIIIYMPVVWFVITSNEKRLREERRERLRNGSNPLHAPTLANRYDAHSKYNRTFFFAILGFWVLWLVIAGVIYFQLQ